MPCKAKQVINPDTYEVVVLDNKYHAIAKTFSDGLVGYYLDGGGNLRATHSNGAEYEYESWLAFRVWAGHNLSNRIRERGTNFIVKVVTGLSQTSPPTSPKSVPTHRPPWLREAAATPHALSSDSHERDD